MHRWSGFVDSRPHGCTAVAADVGFPLGWGLAGLPERAAPALLPSTLVAAAAAQGAAAAPPSLRAVRKPYRLFNLDVFKYDLRTPLGLYGSLPFLLARGAAATAGALWLSAADTYVDLWQPHDAATGTGGGDGWESHWASEGGAMELVLLPGPSRGGVVAKLAG